MSPVPVNIAVIDKNEIINATVLRSEKRGAAIKIKAIPGGKYLLAEGENGVAPENITLKRAGKNLLVCLEGTELTEPQMIIEGFFDNPGQLIGLGEDGNYHNYISSDGEGDNDAPFLLDGDSSAHVLGAESLTGVGNFTTAAGAFSPALLALGLLGAIMAAAGLSYALSGSGNKGESGNPHHGEDDTDNDNIVGDDPVTLPVSAPKMGDVIDNTGKIQGPIHSGSSTDDSTPTFNGIGTPGNVVIIKDNGEVIASVIVNEEGKWNYTPSPAMEEGQHSIVLIEHDENGTESPETPSFDFIIDTTPPDNSGIDAASDDVGPVTGAISDGSSTDDNKPTLEGTSEPGNIISIIDNGQLIGSTIVGNDGSWNFTPVDELADGEHKLEIVVTDPAGNSSSPSTPISIIVDTDPVGGAFIGEISDGKGPINDGGMTNEREPVVSGPGTPGDLISLIIDDEVIGTTVVGEDGTWMIPVTPGLEDGDHQFEIIVEDPTGNISEPSSPWVVIVDNSAPEKPVLEGVLDDEGDAHDLVMGEVTNDATPTLRGSAEPGSTLNIYDKGKLLGSTLVNADGTWSFEPQFPLEEGLHSLTLTATDGAGNVSEPSAPFDFTLTTGGIASSPAITAVWNDNGSDLERIAENGITNDTTPRIGGTALPGSMVTIYVDGQALGSVTADENGQWSFQVPDTHALKEGLHNLTVQAELAGIAMPESGAWPINIDTTAPGATTGDSLMDDVGSEIGSITTGSTTDDRTPTFSGEGEPGAVVIIRDNGTIIGSVPIDADGNWIFTPSTPLAEGEHSLTTQQEDEAGNTGPESIPIDFTVDTSTVMVSITNVTDNEGIYTGLLATGSLTDDRTPTINGIATPGSTVYVYIDNMLAGVAQANWKGEWQFNATLSSDKMYSITAEVTSPAGETTTTAPFTLTLDTTRPSNSGIEDIHDNVGINQGSIDRGTRTDDNLPTLTGSGKPGEKVTIISNGKPLGETFVKEDGSWSFTPGTKLNDGNYLFETIITDQAGNSRPSLGGYPIIIDTTAPDAPVIIKAIDDSNGMPVDLNSGDTTRDSIPELIGTAEPLATVLIYDNGILIGSTATDASGNWRFKPAPPLENGNHNLTASVRDGAGNEGQKSDEFDLSIGAGGVPSSPAITEVIDDIGVIENIKPGGMTNDTLPELRGSALAGSLVTIMVNGVVVGSAMADAAGRWSFQTTVPLVEGTHTLTVTATKDGMTSVESGAYDIVVDTSAPGAVSAESLYDDVNPQVGAISSGDSTDDNTPTFSGKGEPGATIIIRDNGREIGTAKVNSVGDWTFTPSGPLLDGSHSFTAQQQDVAGNNGPESAAIDFIVDTTALEVSISHVVDNQGAVQGNLSSGSVTDDRTPTLHGNATPNSVVSVFVDGVEVGQVRVMGNGTWSFTLPELPAEGQYQITAQSTTAAGSSDMTAEFTLELDWTAPTNSGITDAFDNVGSHQGILLNNSVTDDTRPTLRGTGEPGEVITLYVNGEKIGSAIVGNGGDWNFTTHELNDGHYDFTITVSDNAGNVSLPSPPFQLTIDTTAPGSGDGVKIGDIIDDVGTVTGSIGNGGVTDDTRPTLIGTSQPGDVVTIIAGGVTLGTAIVGTDNKWTFTPGTDLPQGDTTFEIIVTDSAGNTSEKSDPWTIRVDTVAPVGPAIVSVTDDAGDRTGIVAPGTTTDDATPTVTGTAEANSILYIYNGSTLLGSTSADNAGNWTFIPVTPLSNGDYSLVAVAHDAAGNISPESAKYEFTLLAGGTPPAPAITGVQDDVEGNTGLIAKNGLTNDQQPTIEGTGQPGSVIHIYNGDTLMGSTTVAADARWSFTPIVDWPEGSYKLIAQAENSAGNLSPKTGEYPITIDITVPSAPSNMLFDNVGVTGPIISGSTTDDSTPTFSGQTEPGATVFIKDSDTVIASVTANASGDWNYTPTTPLVDGSYHWSVEAEDMAGNRGPASTPIDFTVDTSGVGVSIDFATDDVGDIRNNLMNNSVTDDTTPTLNGKATPNSVIAIYQDGVRVGLVASAADGSWSWTVTPALSDGRYEFTAAVDSGSGLELPTSNFVLEVDTIAPVGGTFDLISDDVGTIQGSIAEGGFTDDTTPTLSGRGEIGAIVTLFDGSKILGSTTVQIDGSWSFTLPAQNDGTLNLSAIFSDAAGNKSSPTPVKQITIDTVAPVAPAIATVEDNVGNALENIATGDVTNDNRPTLTGTAEANSLVTIWSGAVLVGSVYADSSGNWTLELEAVNALADGTHQLTITATDAAGNISQPSAEWQIIVDTTPPAAPVIIGALDNVGSVNEELTHGGLTNDATPTLRGSSEPDSLVLIYDGTTLIASVVADSSGNWSLELPAALTDGNHSLTATAQDAAGNTGMPSAAWDLIVDTTPPVVPVITAIIDDAGVTEDVLGSLLTNDSTPELRGTAEADSLISIYVDGVAVGSVRTDASGEWAYTLPMQANGVHTIELESVDAAGNSSGKTPAVDLTIDLAVGKPTLTSLVDDSGTLTGGISNGTGVTDDKTPTLSGQAEAGSIVTIYDTAENPRRVLGSVVAEANGLWTFVPPELAEGSHTLVVQAVDPAGNISIESDSWSFNVDTDIKIPVITSVEDNIGAIGDVADGGITDDSTPTLRGIAEAGSTVTIYNGDILLGTTTADASGNWTFTPPELANGTYNFNASAEDVAGNTSGKSDDHTVIIESLITSSTSFNPLAPGAIYAKSIVSDGFQVTRLDSDPYIDGYWYVAGEPNRFLLFSTGYGTSLMKAEIKFPVPARDVAFDFGTMSTGGIAIFYDQHGNELGRVGFSQSSKIPDFNPYSFISDTSLIYSMQLVVTQTFPHSSSVMDNLKLNSLSTSTKGIEALADESDESSTLAIVDEYDRETLTVESTQALENYAVNSKSETSINTLIISGENETINLNALTDNNMTVNTVDITGTGDNILNLDMGTILQISADTLFTDSNAEPLMIKGDAGDIVNLSDKVDGRDTGDWVQQEATVEVDGEHYNVYQHSGENAQLLVQLGVEVKVDNH